MNGENNLHQVQISKRVYSLVEHEPVQCHFQITYDIVDNSLSYGRVILVGLHEPTSRYRHMGNFLNVHYTFFHAFSKRYAGEFRIRALINHYHRIPQA
jgi:hypothetical protein